MSTTNAQSLVIAREDTPSLISTHKVLRNTYGLLSLTLIFSAAAAAASAALGCRTPACCRRWRASSACCS